MAASTSVEAEVRELGDRIRAFRTTRGMSLQALASKVGSTKNHLWKLEKGSIQNPRLEILVALADCFECPLDELVGRSVDQSVIPADISTSLANLSNQELDYVRAVLGGLPTLRSTG